MVVDADLGSRRRWCGGAAARGKQEEAPPESKPRPRVLHEMCGADTHGLQTWEEAPPPFRFSPVATAYVPMQTTITAKLKLVTTPEQLAALRQTQLAAR